MKRVLRVLVALVIATVPWAAWAWFFGFAERVEGLWCWVFIAALAGTIAVLSEPRE